MIRFPANLGSAQSQMRFHPDLDVIMVTRSDGLRALFTTQVRPVFAEGWNTKVARLAINCPSLWDFTSVLFEESNGTADTATRLVRKLVHRANASFFHILRRMPRLRQFYLVHSQPIVTESWKRTEIAIRENLLQCLENAYYLDLSCSPRPPIPTQIDMSLPLSPSAQLAMIGELCRHQMERIGVNPPFTVLSATVLTAAILNIERVIHGDPWSAENAPFANVIEFYNGDPRLRAIEFKKLYFVDRNLQGLCREPL